MIQSNRRMQFQPNPLSTSSPLSFSNVSQKASGSVKGEESDSPSKGSLSSDEDHDETVPEISTKGGVKMPFPCVLWNALHHIDEKEPELAEVISWLPDGKCFRVHDVKEFEDKVQAKFFGKQANYTSFRRQLNLWGFKRVNERGQNYGSYIHPKFCKDDEYLCRTMTRPMKSKMRRGSDHSISEQGSSRPFNNMDIYGNRFPGRDTVLYSSYPENGSQVFSQVRRGRDGIIAAQRDPSHQFHFIGNSAQMQPAHDYRARNALPSEFHMGRPLSREDISQQRRSSYGQGAFSNRSSEAILILNDKSFEEISPTGVAGLSRLIDQSRLRDDGRGNVRNPSSKPFVPALYPRMEEYRSVNDPEDLYRMSNIQNLERSAIGTSADSNLRNIYRQVALDAQRDQMNVSTQRGTSQEAVAYSANLQERARRLRAIGHLLEEELRSDIRSDMSKHYNPATDGGLGHPIRGARLEEGQQRVPVDRGYDGNYTLGNRGEMMLRISNEERTAGNRMSTNDNEYGVEDPRASADGAMSSLYSNNMGYRR